MSVTAASYRAVVAIEVTRVAYGEAAVALLVDRLAAAKAGDRLAPVTVVVPGNYAAVATRRELARRGGVAGVGFLTLYRLAERVGGAALAAVGRRPVSAPVVLQAVRAALAQAPGILAPVAGHPATELALAAAQRELAGVSAVALDALAAQSPRAAEVVRIVRTATDRLRDDWHDEHDLVVAATAVLRAGGVTDIGPVIWYLPERLPAGGAGLLHALAARGPLTVLVGATGVEEADRPVVAALEAAGIAVPPSTGVERPRARRVVSASDPDEEVRAAVRLVVTAAREGVALGRMAVLFGAADPYARLLREHLYAAGIAANGTPVRTVGDMLAGRVLRGLLALADSGFRRPELLAVLSSARVLDAGGRPAPVRVWERVSRAAGVVEGDDWAERLAVFADERVRRAAAAEDDERSSLAGRFRHEADQARSLASFVAVLMGDLAIGDALGTWAEMAAWASGLLDRYVGDDRSGWPEPEREAADRVMAAVERLGGLDALGGPAPTVEVFRRLLDGELDIALQRIGRLGEGVLVGPLSLALGLSLDRVLVVGLAEGTFPDRRLDDSLLPDRERAVTGGQLALRAEHIHDDHRHLLAALAAGPATVCFPRGDMRRSGARTASRWLLDDASALARSPSRLFTADLDAHRGAAWLDVVASFTAGISRLAFPATGQEHRLTVLLRGDGPLSARPLTAADPVLAAGAALAESRRSRRFTRFDGNLAGLDLVPVVDGDRAHSATRLQAWATCPHAYLLEHVLGVEVVEEPERRLRIDPLDKGALVHEVLHRFVGEGGRDRYGSRRSAPRCATSSPPGAEPVASCSGGGTGRGSSPTSPASLSTTPPGGCAPERSRWRPSAVSTPSSRCPTVARCASGAPSTASTACLTGAWWCSTTRLGSRTPTKASPGPSPIRAAPASSPPSTPLPPPASCPAAVPCVSTTGSSPAPAGSSGSATRSPMPWPRRSALCSPPSSTASTVGSFHCAHPRCRAGTGSTAGSAHPTGSAPPKPVAAGRPSAPTHCWPPTSNCASRVATMGTDDAAARAAVRDDLSATLFLEAGAGSGKTTSLVERFVALVAAGIPADRIAAITFTEKAAGELADRIRQALEKAGDQAALNLLDRAAIGTLHAFAQRILNEHPIEAGLPPRLEVLDEISSQLAFEERWGAFVDELLEDEAVEMPFRLLLASGIDLRHLRDVALAFADNWDLVAERLGPADRPPMAPLDLGEVLAGLDAMVAWGDDCTDPDDKLLARLDELATWCAALRAAVDDDARLTLFGDRERPSKKVGNVGRKGSWPDIGEVRVAVAEFGDRCDALRRQVQQVAIGHVADAIGRFTVASAEERRGAGRLEFHDLLVLARAVLRDPEHGPAVRAGVRHRYQRLLLDEFQDTDPIQVELATLLAVDPGREAGDWRDAVVESGRLFFVGDPKQSIYRFRRADIEVFLAARDRLAGSVQRLTTNFRTTAAVLGWVNHTFEHLIVEEPGSQPAYEALHAHRRQAAPVGPSVAMLGGAPHPAATSADGLRRAEADDVAEMARRAVAEVWSVADGTGWRPARWGDVAVLLPARTSLRQLEAALESAGVPYRAETSSLVYGTGEVRDLLMVARAVEDPTDSLAVVAALRTPAFGCGDDDLYTWRVHHRGWWDHQVPLPAGAPTDHPVAAGLAWLGALHRERLWLSPSQVLDRIARERRLLEVAFAHPRPRDLWRRLRFVVDQARAWEEAGGVTLRQYLEWVKLLGAEGSRVIETVLPETDDDAVRILTVHGAKGLEFAVTILSGLTTLLQGRPAGVQVRFPPGTGWALKLGAGVRTEEFEMGAALEEQMDRHERLRLLYVAATRARDHLVVSVHRKEARAGGKVADTAAQVLWDAGHDGPGVVIDPVPGEVAAEIGDPVAVISEPLPALVPWERWEAERAEVLRLAARPLATSATTLAKLAAGAASAADPGAGRGPDPGLAKDGRDITCHRGRRVGTAPPSVVPCTESSKVSTSPPATGSKLPWRPRLPPRACPPG